MSAQSKKPIKDINLIPKDKWETGVVGKLLRWALNVGRYVVVFTELIVISAFLFRFGLDRQLTDLNEEIEEKKMVVNSYGDLEEKFKYLQLQLQTIKEEEEAGLPVKLILDNISQMTPIDAVYKAININKTEVSLEGQVLSETGLATLLTEAQTKEIFSEVILDNVSSATEKSQAIDFRMTLLLKEEAGGKVEKEEE